MKVVYLWLLIAMSFVSSLEGQTPNLDLSKGRFFTNEGYEILFQSAITEGEQLKYFIANVNEPRYKNLANLLQIETQSGTHAKEFAIGTGASALVGAGLGILRAAANPDIEIEGGKAVAIVGGLTAVGTLIGALIGQGKPKYQMEYEAPNKNVSISPSNRGLGIAFTF